MKHFLIVIIAGIAVTTRPSFAGVAINLPFPVKIGNTSLSGQVNATRVKQISQSQSCKANNDEALDKFAEIAHNLTAGFCRVFRIAASARKNTGKSVLSENLDELKQLKNWPSELWPRHGLNESISLEPQGAGFNIISKAFQTKYYALAKGVFLSNSSGQEQLLLWQDSSGLTATFATCRIVIVDTSSTPLEPLEVLWVGRCG